MRCIPTPIPCFDPFCGMPFPSPISALSRFRHYPWMDLKQEAISSDMVETAVEVGDFARLHWNGNTDFANSFYVFLSNLEGWTHGMTRTEAKEFQSEINKARQTVTNASLVYREVMLLKKEMIKQLETIGQDNTPEIVQKRRQLLAEVNRINALQFPKMLTEESVKKYSADVHTIKTVPAVVTEKQENVETLPQQESMEFEDAEEYDTADDDYISYIEISTDIEEPIEAPTAEAVKEEIVVEIGKKSEATPPKVDTEPFQISTERKTAEQEIAQGKNYITSITPKFSKYESLVASCLKDWDELEKQNYYSDHELLEASKLLLRAQRALFDKIEDSTTGFSAFWRKTPGIMKLYISNWSTVTENDEVIAEIKNILVRTDRRANDAYFDVLEREKEFFSKTGNGTKWYTPIARHYHKAIKQFRQISNLRDEGNIPEYLSKWNKAFVEMEQLRPVFLQLKEAHEAFEQKLMRINSMAEVHAEDMSSHFKSLFDDALNLEQQLSKRELPMSNSKEILEMIERIVAINERPEDN